ncbi:hypothetical protein CAL29_23680 [Bordetella genomosp. 10]|uniref:Nitroreductase domain-containing protein n=1 Tax=Bordetella genomosp. 10 TaxID=1416804 RepID=A0A261S0T8_9BORD|nr:SagB/ThcOx family dehydrogenase [Bordetella genomosp. 10]OZI30958.1 hypothetical protein CAL29_23680 [Bordetella genomosp. 10]
MKAENRLETVLAFHARTKHRLDAYAPGPDGLDWATQPDPFRTYEGAEQVALARPEPAADGPDFDTVAAGAVDPAELSFNLVSQLLYDALAISAWKVAGGDRWAVRCNPSSGNLHPTEAHLLLPAIDGLGQAPALYHYRPLDHALERRTVWKTSQWDGAMAALPPSTFLVALTSIHWREAWKYGERAYRYCQHDVGHAIAQLSYAAAALGWHVRPLSAVSDDDIALLAGISAQVGEDGEHPDVLLAASPQAAAPDVAAAWVPPCAWTTARDRPPFKGVPNRLSPSHRPWPEIDRVAAATRRERQAGSLVAAAPTTRRAAVVGSRPGLAARRLFRTRRSAVEMDGQAGLLKGDFGRLLARLLPATATPWAAWPWASAIHPVFLVHRVIGLERGIYLLVREPGQESRLREALTGFSEWEPIAGLPGNARLVRLGVGDTRRFAAGSNCHQAIAANGVFSVAMLADFERTLQQEGPWSYRRLFWEAGMVGQVLYLEAEAVGLRGTGIGCFFDDVIHDAFGLSGMTFQSLYGFTVGGARHDSRIQTEPAYEGAHRE